MRRGDPDHPAASGRGRENARNRILEDDTPGWWHVKGFSRLEVDFGVRLSPAYERFVEDYVKIRRSARLFECEIDRSEEHTSELQSRENIVCRLLLENKKNNSASTTA